MSDSPAASPGRGHPLTRVRTWFYLMVMVLVTALPLDALAASHHLVAPATSVNLDITSESVSNLSGGLAQGTLHDTLVDASAGLGTDALGWWEGGRFWLDLRHIDSDNPSGRLVGDFQSVSNIAARPANRLYEVWFRQYLGHTDLKLRAGYIDLNSYFARVPYAAQINNASFGILPTISADAPTSIYPKPGAGMILSDGWGQWQTALGLFQGHPQDRGQLFGHGHMAIAELVHQAPAELTPDRITRLGVWRYSQPDAARDGGPPSNWGVYAILSQDLLPLSGSAETHAFGQIGASPSHLSVSPYYLGGGLAFQGLIADHPQDILSVSMSRAWVRNISGLRPETSYELSYLWNLGSHFAIQPDLQYISQPAGTTHTVPDAFVAIVRFYLSL